MLQTSLAIATSSEHRPAKRPLEFDNPGLLEALERASLAEIDAAALGVVGMSRDGTVLVYNRWEAQRAGLDPSRVLGRHFFSAVAPCTNNERVAGRFMNEEELDATLDYTFAFRLRLVSVRLRLLRSAGADMMYLVVAPREKR